MAHLSFKSFFQRLLFTLAVAGWFGWFAVMSFGFYEFARSSRVPDPASGRIVADSDKGVTFFVHPWEYALFHWELPISFITMATGMGLSFLFFREEYKRQMRHPLTITAMVLCIGGAIWVVHTYSK